MTIDLPYNFDTSATVKVILRGAAGLIVLVTVGILYSLFVSHSIGAAAQLLLSGAVAAYFTRIFVRNLTASMGTITANAVVVQPSRLYGIRLAGPEGRFRIDEFKAIRVERIIGSTASIRSHERVSLIGKDGTPDILVARTALESGFALGRELAVILGLPYQEELAPY